MITLKELSNKNIKQLKRKNSNKLYNKIIISDTLQEHESKTIIILTDICPGDQLPVTREIIGMRSFRFKKTIYGNKNLYAISKRKSRKRGLL